MTANACTAGPLEAVSTEGTFSGRALLPLEVRVATCVAEEAGFKRPRHLPQDLTSGESGGVRPRRWGPKTGSDNSVPCASPSFEHVKPSGLLIVMSQGGKHCGYPHHADDGPKVSKGCVVGPRSRI